MEQRAVQELTEVDDGLTSTLSPIRRLPPEILGDIFLLAVLLGGRKNYMIIRPPRAPWYLGLVCSSWREIAVGFPVLWSNIYVSGRAQESMLRAQVNRSGNAPLDVVFDVRGSNVTERPFVQLADLIAHSNRWRTLRIECRSNSQMLLEWLGPAKGELRRLTELKYKEHADIDDPPYNVVDLFLDAPALRELDISGAEFLRFPSSQITHYKKRECWDCIPFYDWRNFASLIEYDILESGSNLPNFGGTVTLQNLRKLVLDHNEQLELLVAPRLEKYYTNDTTSMDSVASFIHRSGCLLTSLAFSFCPLNEGIISILHATPALESLAFNAYSFTHSDDDNFVNRLIIRLFNILTVPPLDELESTMVCPRLKSFAFGEGQARAESADAARAAFVVMLNSRLQLNPVRLSVVRIQNQLSGLLLDNEIQTFRDHGIDVAFVDAKTLSRLSR